MTFRKLKVLSCEHSLSLFKQIYNEKSLPIKGKQFSFKKVEKDQQKRIFTKLKRAFY